VEFFRQAKDVFCFSLGQAGSAERFDGTGDNVGGRGEGVSDGKSGWWIEKGDEFGFYRFCGCAGDLVIVIHSFEMENSK